MALLITTSAARADTICPNQITTCGCVIAAAGSYKVTAALSQSANGSFCLQVDAAGVGLQFGGNAITGPPPPVSPVDIGIQLTKHATKAIIVGGGATISGFGEGIEIDSMGAIISDLKADSNGDGIVVIKARDIQLTKIDASNNNDVGLGLLISSENQISNLTANGNASGGIFISGISDANRTPRFKQTPMVSSA